jgi:serine/threonine protein kinase
MATMFGRFEIQSELSKSDTASIYKAMDTKSEQVVALKTQDLGPLGERAAKFVETLIAEGESTRDLAHQTIVALYGAGEIEGQFCAAMEYIQGNSIATMLARKEGFSIWDLLDITRQVCAGLEHAADKGVVHCSLEPAKIMVQWDGMVKMLGYGISNMSLIGAECGKSLGPLMSYCSPEQIRGEAIDLRSNLFTLGAILYEMVVARRAFDDPDPVGLVSRIENEMPAVPSSVNPKIHPLMSDLVMKALAKDPRERYQSARELLDDLEKCKETGKKFATETTKPAAAAGAPVGPAAAARKFVSSELSSSLLSDSLSAPMPAPSGPSVTPRPVVRNPASTVSPRTELPVFAQAGAPAFETSAAGNDSNAGVRLISDFEGSSVVAHAARGSVSAAVAAEPKNEMQSSRLALDPLMSEPASSSSGKSFSDLAEMPPLKEPLFPPPASEPAEPLPASQASTSRLSSSAKQYSAKQDKPRIAPREIADKALHQIATIPPRLMLFSIMGAVGLILVVAIAVFFHVRSEDEDVTAAPHKIAAPAPSATSTSNQPTAATPRAAQPAPPPPLVEVQPKLTVRSVEKRSAKNKQPAPAPAPAPVVVAGEALIDSTPQGASFQVDGKGDPSWVTPFTVTGLSPGKHIISVNKSGYSSDIHSIDVAAGGKLSLAIHLTPVNALVVVNSTPAGADITIDGRSTGRVTPAQFAVEKGSHTVLLRKHGYLDETTTADLGPAQNFQYAPTLRALGNTEDMRTIGAFNRLLGRGGQSTAGMGSIVVRTQPKGAQVAINQQVLDKTSPLGVAVGPGNYIVDITLTGFKPIHKVVSVDRGNRTAIDEILERQ